MLDCRERALAVDVDVYSVLDFMEKEVAAGKLVRVAAAVAALAPILWSELVPLVRNQMLSLTPEFGHVQRSTATQSFPVPACANDDLVEAAGSQQLK
ncbi:MAG TPA: hypothetical protein VL155_06910 [Terriglobales bacterium]|jgi:hypothetical protein|nr:hypothetical protein [Terriglobales bacterium]